MTSAKDSTQLWVKRQARPGLPPGPEPPDEVKVQVSRVPWPPRPAGLQETGGAKGSPHLRPPNWIQAGAATWRPLYLHSSLGIACYYPIFQARLLRGRDVNNMFNIFSITCYVSHTARDWQSLTLKLPVTCPGKPSPAPSSRAQESGPLLCSLGNGTSHHRNNKISLLLGHQLRAAHGTNTRHALFSPNPLRNPEDWYHYLPHCTKEKQKLRKVKPLAQVTQLARGGAQGGTPNLLL